jgi:hypothetical protein
MKTVIIKTVDGALVCMLLQRPELSDKDFEEVKLALILTLANMTGLQLTTEETT